MIACPHTNIVGYTFFIGICRGKRVLDTIWLIRRRENVSSGWCTQHFIFLRWLLTWGLFVYTACMDEALDPVLNGSPKKGGNLQANECILSLYSCCICFDVWLTNLIHSCSFTFCKRIPERGWRGAWVSQTKGYSSIYLFREVCRCLFFLPPFCMFFFSRERKSVLL